jgi:sugar lactone lactonase YvrE
VSHWSANKHITVWNLDTYTQINSIPLPVKHICCAGFGGSVMKDLYVATSKFGLPTGDPDFDAGAGGIFRTRLEVQGMKEYFYPDKP